MRWSQGKILVPLALVLLLALGAAAFALIYTIGNQSSSRHPTPLIDSAALDVPPGEGIDIPSAVHDSITESGKAFSSNVHDYMITSVAQDGDWAIIGGYLKDKTTQEVVTPEGATFIAHQENGVWKATGLGTALGRRWLCQVPPSVINSENRESFAMRLGITCP